MDPKLSCMTASERLPMYVRGELADHERNELHRHLSSCDACRSELAEVEWTMETLGTFAAERPAPHLRAGVLATAESERLAPLLVHAVEPPRPGLKATVLAAVERESQKTTGASVIPLKPRGQRVARLLAAAALVVAGIVFGSTLGGNGLFGTDTPTEEEIPRGHETQTVALSGSGPSSATIDHYRHDNFRLNLSVEGYDPTPSGSHYAVWVRGKSGDVAIGTFRLKQLDDFTIPFALGVNPTEYPELVVTLEPNDGDPALTGPIVTRGRFDVETVQHGQYED